MESIKSSFLEYHQDNGFSTHESFPLVIDDPTVMFTNATITPFKSMFTGDTDFSNFALLQKCLRLGGTGGNAETARTNANYTSLFDMLGSGLFEVSHDDAVDYFVDMLGAIGLERKNLIFSSLGACALETSLNASPLDAGQIRIIENPEEIQHEWSFGEGDLHGQGIIAWFASEGYGHNPALLDCIQIGRIVHIDGISEGKSVIPFEHAAFDVGLGMGRVELALTGDTEFSSMPLRKLSRQYKDTFENVSDGDARYMANLSRVIDELTGEGVMPGNKKHAYVLRKVIRSLIEEVWLQSHGFVEVQDTLDFFIEGSISKANAAKALSDEEAGLRRTLSKVGAKRKKHPEMTPADLHATFGIKPSLINLL